MAPTTVALLCIVIAGAIGAVVKFLFRIDTKLEDKQRACGLLAGILKSYGLKRIPAFLVDMSIKDLSGAWCKIKELADLFTGDPEAVVREFDEVFKTVLFRKMQTVEGRAFINAVLKEANGPEVKAE